MTKIIIPFTNWEKIRLTGAIIGILICIGALFYVTNNEKKNNEYSVKLLKYYVLATKEQGYAEGQADAIKGAIRIVKLNDTTYVWTSAPFKIKPLRDTIYIKR